MSPAHVIDISSDDEPPPASKAIDAEDTLPARRPGNARPLHKADSPEWSFSPSKRRRLSPVARAPPLLPLKAAKKTDKSHVETKPNASNACVAEEDDPIIFTSSIHDHTAEIHHADRESSDLLCGVISSDDSLPDDILGALSHNVPGRALSSRTEALLASMNAAPAGGKGRANAQSSRHGTTRRKRSATARSEDSEASTSINRPPSKKSMLTAGERAERDRTKKAMQEKRVRDREEARSLKGQEKEDEKARKRVEREEKAKEKLKMDQLAEANRIKVDKKDSTPEMIVDLPVSLADTAFDVMTRELHKNAGAETAIYQSSIPNVIKWRRKSKRKWNAELDHWEALPYMVVEDEQHILCYMDARSLASLVLSSTNDGETLDSHVAKLKSLHHSPKIIYLIEGFTKLCKQSKNAENRAYRAQVLAQDPNLAPAHQPSTSTTTKRNKGNEVLDIAAIEAALLRLQVIHSCLIHHTATPGHGGSAEWLLTFTQHISTIPYRRHLFDPSRPFCMESGQVKTGEDRDDTFIRMLQEVVRVTPPIALGIWEAYPDVGELVKAFRNKGNLVLEDLEKKANRNGTSTGARVGQAISRRLYKIFMGLDPESMDV